MGSLIDGQWTVDAVNSSIEKGEFKRQQSAFRDAVSAQGKTQFQAEKNRYHLYVSMACPWAHRTLIVRTLKGLEDAIGVSVVSPKMGEDGWNFTDQFPGTTGDAVNHTDFLRQLYVKANPTYTGKATVPILWDKHLATIVNNESAEIIRMLNTEFNEFATNPQLDLYPNALQEEIDQLNAWIYRTINNGVYKVGFATKQKAYERNVTILFDALTQLETRLATRQYLVGEVLTEADIRLFTTLIRFDLVYFAHFKCNLQHLESFEHIHRYVVALYQREAVQETVNFDHIKTHYYWSQDSINPTRIVPLGPRQLLLG